MQAVMRWVALLLALLLVSGAGSAIAQSTGGSFGGGSFGGGGGSSGSSGGGSWGGGSSGSSGGGSWGGGSSGSSGSNWGSSGSNDYGSGSYSTGSGGGGGGCFGLICCFLVFGGVIALVLISKKKKGAAPGASAGGLPAYHGPGAMHVSKLSLGVDWRARRELQDTLKRLAETGDTSSPQGLAHLLRETVLALRRAELSWLYVAHESQGPLSPQNAEQNFNQLATSARAAFRAELVRGAGGHVHQQSTPEMQANKNEGEGTVVVHLIVAAYRPLQALSNPDANQIRMALDNRAALTADQLGALEVVWSPAAENDRMSTAELEQFYPQLRLIDPNSIAGRLFCTYCRGPFAMELLSCPHCGAPAEASQANRAPPGAPG